MRSLGIGLLLGLVKGLAIGALFGVGVTYGLGWPVPAGSLLGYLVAMAATGTAGIVGGRAPWSEGAWLVALLKALAGVAVGAFLYWVEVAHADASLPASIASWLAIPDGARGLAAEDGSLSWIAYPPLSITVIAALFGSLVELDALSDQGDESSKKKPAGRASEAKRTALENADTVGPTTTRKERRG